jgi:murein DD-endopeptidase MepM/ murein hydrolase activator NlpD
VKKQKRDRVNGFREAKAGSFIVLILFIAIIAGVVFVYNAPMFEREMAKIDVKTNGYWNLRDPLNIDISDASGVKSYSVIALKGDERIKLASESFAVAQEGVTLAISAPKRLYALKDKNVQLHIEVTDGSKWNFMAGNSISADVKLKIDKKKPRVSIITNSYAIRKGGSALIIFKAEDPNLDELYIETNFGKKFKPQPFYKEGYYISLVAWPVMEPKFKATVIATDSAGNIGRAHIPLRLRSKEYRTSKINLSDKFLEGKIAELAEEFQETAGIKDSVEQFKTINETVRENNEKVIHEITSKVSTEMLTTFAIRPFYPLKNAAVVARFGDHRLYYYNNEQISESYHLGLDLASVKMGKIKVPSPSTVVFAQDNGIYGNMPVLLHGLGLYTIYGHCSSINVHEGDQVGTNAHIANTGMSGYAMGDHLHFGVLVQGIEVRPEEWMDKQWIRLNVTDVIKNAKKIVKRQ